MTKVLVLGASGQIARWAIDMLAGRDDVSLTLMLRDASKLRRPAPRNADVVEGDVVDSKPLDDAMVGRDLVYANLAGNVDDQASNIVRSMKALEWTDSFLSPRSGSMTRFQESSASGTAARLASILGPIGRPRT
jgi:putative NADH-flavin reductase